MLVNVKSESNWLLYDSIKGEVLYYLSFRMLYSLWKHASSYGHLYGRPTRIERAGFRKDFWLISPMISFELKLDSNSIRNLERNWSVILTKPRLNIQKCKKTVQKPCLQSVFLQHIWYQGRKKFQILWWQSPFIPFIYFYGVDSFQYTGKIL